MIKAICFDLDGIYFTPKGKNSFHEGLISEYGIPKETVDGLMYRSEEMAQLVRGKITPADFWNKVRTMTGITASDEELANRWIRDYEVDERVKAVVLKAKAQGFKTCTCTNNNGVRLPRLVERYRLGDVFDVIVSSHETGFTKPSKEIFLALLEKLGVSPQELIYSDDNPARLSGAKEIGIQTFVFQNFDQFMDELKKRGVNLG